MTRFPHRDLEPAISEAWKATGKLSIADPAELAPHYLSLLEIQEKLEHAIALASRRDAA